MFNRLFILILINLIVLSGCKSGDSPKDEKVSKEENKEKTILSAHLNYERFLLTYSTPFFDQKTIIFSNPSNIDTIISKTIFLKKPVIAEYTVLEVDRGNRETSFYVLLHPGDSIPFHLTNGMYLATDKVNNKNIISPPNISYYYKFDNDKSKYGKGNYDEADFKEFYNRLNETAKSENARIESLFKNKQIDLKNFSIQKYYSNVLYYSNLFTYIGKKKELSDYILKVYSAHSDSAIRLFTDENAVLSDKLAPIFFGILKIKLRNKKENYSDYNLLFQEAIHTNFGQFKPGLLFRFLKTPDASELFTKNVLKEISALYPNTIYSAHASEISNKNLEISKIKPLDTLINLSEKQISWVSFINNSDKYLMVDYWASWCAPCRALFPLMDSAKKQFINKNIEFVSVNINADSSDWKIASKAEAKYLKFNNYYLLQNRKAPLLKKYGINSIPRIMVFKNGEIISGNFTLPSEPGFIDELKRVISK